MPPGSESLRAARHHRAALATVAAALAAGSAASAADLLTNLIYESPGGVTTQIDLYTPSEGGEEGGVGVPPPTLLWIHGGGWFDGDKADNPDYCFALADAGYNVVAVNYTKSVGLAPGFPQAVRDIKAVIRWVRTTGVETYGLAPTIVVTGESAGAHLAMMAGTVVDEPFFEPLEPPPGGYRVEGVVAFAGPTDLVFEIEQYGPNPAFELFLGGPLSEETLPNYVLASPLLHVTSCAAPHLLVHAIADNQVGFPHAVLMADALTAAGVMAALPFYDTYLHGFAVFGGDKGAAELVLEWVPQLLATSARPDLNCDGVVDGADMGLLFSAWQSDAADADLDNDGLVDASDLGVLLGQWTEEEREITQ